MLEQELIQNAINKLNRQTGLGVTFKAYEKGRDDGEIRVPGVEECLDVECKKWLNPATLHKHLAIIKAKKLISKVVLLTDYINPNQATLLKEQNIPFIDLAGNTYINLPPVYIDIQGKKPEKPHIEMILKKQLGKAFQPKGMKVVLMLLIQADLVKEPLRTIADVSEVALGTVKQVIDDLIYQGFVVKNGQNTKVLVNKTGLLDKWLDAYPTAVEAKLEQEVYTTDNIALLKQLELGSLKALWGGEYAAELYDNYLYAKDYLVYVEPENKIDVLKAARLRRVKTDEISNDSITKVILIKPLLATKKLTGSQAGLAHPYLIYANLVASLDPRNIDAAGRFYAKYIA